MKAVVVTGASSGIGYAIVKILIANGFMVFGSVRNEQDAERLSNDFGKPYFPLIFDITDEAKLYQAAAIVREQLQGKTLAGLVNNAGIAVPGALIYLPIDDLRRQLETNLVGQLMVTQAFVPLLGEDKTLTGEPGKIINIGSTAGKMVNPFLGAYCISKFGMEAFSEVLRMELMIFGIDVILIGPGAVESKMWEKGEKFVFPEKMLQSVYVKPLAILKEYMLKTLSKDVLPADTIGCLVLKIMNTKKTKLRYAAVPRKWLYWTIPRLLPKRLMQWVITKSVGLQTVN